MIRWLEIIEWKFILFNNLQLTRDELCWQTKWTNKSPPPYRMPTTQAPTNKDRDLLRKNVIEFCKNSRSLSDIKTKFGIGGISAGNILSALRHRGTLIWDKETKTYTKAPPKKLCTKCSVLVRPPR